MPANLITGSTWDKMVGRQGNVFWGAKSLDPLLILENAYGGWNCSPLDDLPQWRPGITQAILWDILITVTLVLCRLKMVPSNVDRYKEGQSQSDGQVIFYNAHLLSSSRTLSNLGRLGSGFGPQCMLINLMHLLPLLLLLNLRPAEDHRELG